MDEKNLEIINISLIRIIYFLGSGGILYFIFLIIGFFFIPEEQLLRMSLYVFGIGSFLYASLFYCEELFFTLGATKSRFMWNLCFPEKYDSFIKKLKSYEEEK